MAQELKILLSLESMSALTNLNNFVSKAGSQLKALALNVAASYVGITGLMKFDQAFRGAIDLQEQLGRVNQRTGLSVGLIEGLREQGGRTNVTMDELNVSLGQFARHIFDAGTGVQKSEEMFQRLGISVTDSNGKLRSTDAVLIDLANKFHNMADGPEKAAAATALFGRAGRELIPVLDQGGESMARLGAQSPISQESVDSATEFNEKLRQLHITIGLIFVRVANELLPALNSLATRFDASAKSAEATRSSVAGLADLMKGLLTIVLVVGLAFENLGQYIGMAAAAIYDDWEIASKAVIAIFQSWEVYIQRTITLLGDLPSAFMSAAKAIGDISLGRYGQAGVEIGNLGKIKDDAKAAASAGIDTAKIGADAVDKILHENLTQYGNYFAQVKQQWTSLSAFLHSMWSGGSKSSGPAGVTTPGAPDDLGPNANSLKDFKEYAALQDEVFKQQMKWIESDPFQTKGSKAEAQLPLVAAQLKALDASLQQSKLNEKAAQTDNDRLAAQTESVKLQGEINDLLREQQTLAGKDSLFFNIGKDFTDMQDKLGTLKEQLASVATSPFSALQSGAQAGFESLFQPDKIIGTRLGQVLTQQGQSFGAKFGMAMQKSFESSLSKMMSDFVTWIAMAVVKWVAGQIEMAVTGAAAGATAGAASLATVTALAASTAAIWSTPATLATIATLGSAAIGAPALIAASEAATLGISAVRDSGGPGSAGSSYLIGTGAQPELFVPNTAGHFYPRSQLSTIAGRAQGGNTTVEGHKVALHFYDERPHPADYAKTSEFENHVVNIARKNRVKIGVGT